MGGSGSSFDRRPMAPRRADAAWEQPTQTCALYTSSFQGDPPRLPGTQRAMLQLPHSPAAETRSFAGPWLRFGSGTGPLDGKEWRSSVLCVTRAAAAAPGKPASISGDGGSIRASYPADSAGISSAAGLTAEPAAPMAVATAAGAAPCPVLLLRDTRGGGGERRLDQPSALDSCEGWTAWRFELELSLTEWQRPVEYHVEAGEQGLARGCELSRPGMWGQTQLAAEATRGMKASRQCHLMLAMLICPPCPAAGGHSTPTYTFWLPALGQAMHWCEGRRVG